VRREPKTLAGGPSAEALQPDRIGRAARRGQTFGAGAPRLVASGSVTSGLVASGLVASGRVEKGTLPNPRQRRAPPAWSDQA